MDAMIAIDTTKNPTVMENAAVRLHIAMMIPAAIGPRAFANWDRRVSSAYADGTLRAFTKRGMADVRAGASIAKKSAWSDISTKTIQTV